MIASNVLYTLCDYSKAPQTDANILRDFMAQNCKIYKDQQ